MKLIDFTPASYRVRTARRLARRRTTRSLSLLIAAMATFSMWKFAQVRSVRAEIESIRSASANQSPIVDLATSVRHELEQARRREQMRSTARGGAPMHGVLAELSRCLPADAWATRLYIAQPGVATVSPETPGRAHRGAPPDDGRNVRITGYARDEAAIGALLTNLSASPLFEDVGMVYARAVDAGGLEGREFELACRLPLFE